MPKDVTQGTSPRFLLLALSPRAEIRASPRRGEERAGAGWVGQAADAPSDAHCEAAGGARVARPNGHRRGGESAVAPRRLPQPPRKPVRSCHSVRKGLRRWGRLRAVGGDGVGPRGERGSRAWTFGLRRESTRMPERLALGLTLHSNEENAEPGG